MVVSNWNAGDQIIFFFYILLAESVMQIFFIKLSVETEKPMQSWLTYVN